jgi:hypothetical protein
MAEPTSRIPNVFTPNKPHHNLVFAPNPTSPNIKLSCIRYVPATDPGPRVPATDPGAHVPATDPGAHVLGTDSGVYLLGTDPGVQMLTLYTKLPPSR